MSLVMAESEIVPSEPKAKFSWDEWYQKNRQRLSEKRARRYREDPEYRKAALERSRRQRAEKKEPVTDGYTVAFNDAAKELGITVWQLREWRRKDYFPEPSRREGRLWFKPEQLLLLQQLQAFFLKHGVRVSPSKRPALEAVIQVVYANWN